jgi:hypothetical protein
MGGMVGAVRFPDGKIMYWRDSGYTGEPPLYETLAEYATRNSLPRRSWECSCRYDEPVELYIYDTWSGRACRHCRVITDFGGFNDDDDDGADDLHLRDHSPGEPDWLRWDANVEPTIGGEAEPTLAFWDGLHEIVTKALLLPVPDSRYQFHDYSSAREPGGDGQSVAEAAFARNAGALRQVARSIGALLRDFVTPELLDHADGWSRLCDEAAAICESMSQFERRYRRFYERTDVSAYWEQTFDWAEAVCDAVLEGSSPPPDPKNPVMEAETDRFEEQHRASRRRLQEEIVQVTQRGAKHQQNSFLLSARLSKQHRLGFRWLRH